MAQPRPHFLEDVRPDLVDRAVAAVRAFQSTVLAEDEEYQGITAEQVFMDAGLSERDQIRYMGLVSDRIRDEWGEAPADTKRTSCHWCGRGFETPSGRGIHETGCRDTLARDRRILDAYLGGRTGTQIAEAEGMGWSAVYRILRRHGATPQQQGVVA